MASPNDIVSTIVPSRSDQTHLSILTLTNRIQALTPELRDLILDHTLIAGREPHKNTVIDPNYQPPWQISVDSRSRQVVTAIYYAKTCFGISANAIQDVARLREIRTMKSKAIPESDAPFCSERDRVF
ncbi:hypothetical protein Slin14017_G063110 [Septoria linicola]|nr:hypothetical protein Slin14017_G063110 [Septoria linicola]